MHGCVLSCFSCDTVAPQAPLSMEFSRQEFWSGLLFSLPGDLPDPGKGLLWFLHCRRIFTPEPPGKPQVPTLIKLFSKQLNMNRFYYQVWNRSPIQVGCMRQMLGAGTLGWPRGMGWGGRWEGGSAWGAHVNPWLIHVNVWQKPLQYCKVISLQLIKINEKNILSIYCCSFKISVNKG